jgi:pyruvate carboxylase
LTAARDLNLHTVAVYTAEDSNHASYADVAVLLDEPSGFTNINDLVDLAKKHRVDAVHPGYGFLSESADFARALGAVNILFIGPSPEILEKTASKTHARALAEASNVPTLPASTEPVRDVEQARQHVARTGLPVMLKAVDGGGGRGIRLVRELSELQDSLNRACGESPSGQVFVERAAIDGFRHIEVQVLGDIHGNVAHLWERECSIQRR